MGWLTWRRAYRWECVSGWGAWGHATTWPTSMQLPESGGKQRHRQHSTASTLSRGMAAAVASDTKTRFSLIGGGTSVCASHRFHTSRTHRDYVCCDGFRRHKTNNGRSPCELIVGLRHMPCIICIRSEGWLLCAMETIFIGSHGGPPPHPRPLSAFELSRFNCLKLCGCFAQKCHTAESAVWATGFFFFFFFESRDRNGSLLPSDLLPVKYESVQRGSAGRGRGGWAKPSREQNS